MGIACMLDWVMEYVMIRLKKNSELCNERWRDPVCPKIVEIIDEHMSNAPGNVPFNSTKHIWKVMSRNGDKYSVDLNAWTCGVGSWISLGFLANMPWLIFLKMRGILRSLWMRLTTHQWKA